MKKMKLSVRLYLGFALIVLLIVGIVLFEVISLQNLAIVKDRMESANSINDAVTTTRRYTLEYFDVESDSAKDNVYQSYTEAISLIDEGVKLYKNTDNESVLELVRADLTTYYDSFLAYKDFTESKEMYQTEMFASTDVSLSDLESILLYQENDFIDEMNSNMESKNITVTIKRLIDIFEGVMNGKETMTKMYNIAVAQLRFFLLNEKEYDSLVVESASTVKDNYEELHGALVEAEEKDKVITAIKGIGGFVDAHNAYKDLITGQDAEKETMYDLSAAIIEKTELLATEQVEKMDSRMKSATTLSIIIGIVGVLLGMLYAAAISKNLVKQITANMDKLSTSSNLVADASVQLSDASGQMSEGSTEQAASIEETSATMEETSSMAQQIASNTKQATILSVQASKAAENGSDKMKNMLSSIEELRDSSSDIAKIIKVIDDIAFQTNMLALNAAVEAARAGDAGLGFAVVAEEVRNLAQKSAQAAKNTEDIIQHNLELSGQGVKLSKEVNVAFDEIISTSKDVDRLIDEIAAASDEQSRGTAQVTQAIGQMEKVVQQNTATAQESATSAGELQRQARSLAEVVREFEMLVRGANAKDLGMKSRQVSNGLQVERRKEVPENIQGIDSGMKKSGKKLSDVLNTDKIKEIVKRATAKTPEKKADTAVFEDPENVDSGCVEGDAIALNEDDDF